MSEESTPPPLRLKARLRPDGEPPAPPPTNAAQPEPPPPSPPVADAAPKLRLKPRLDSPAPAAEIRASDPAPVPIDAPAESRPFQLKPRTAPLSPTPDSVAPPALVDPVTPPPPPAEQSPPLAVEPSHAPPADAPKFKFKPKAVAGPPPPDPIATNRATEFPAPPPKLPPPPPLKTKTAPPFPVVVEPPVAPRKIPLPGSVPHLRAPSNVAETDLAASVNPKAARPRATKKILLAVAVGGAVVVAALGYHWWKTRSLPPPAVAIAPAVSRPKVSTPQTIAPALVGATTSIAALPKKLIDDAQNTLTGRRTLEQNRIDALAAGEEPSDKRAINTPPPSTFTPAPTASKPAVSAPVTSTSPLSPGITVTTATEVAGNASPAFRAWVAQVKLNGVFHGSPPRALINGRIYRAGQVVDDTLGITFEAIDAGAETIVFRDRSGATASRRY